MKKIISVLLVAVLLLSVTGCGNDRDDYISQLEQENAQLRSQIEDLAAQLDALGYSSSFSSWTLNASARKDLSGAEVSLTATPMNYEDGQSAVLVVRLDGQEMTRVNCDWDGKTYTAAVDLTAADGYGYYCILTAADGSEEEILLNSPESPVIDTLVYMETALSAYANIFVTAWENTDNQLSITSGYIQVQTPRISTSGTSMTLDKAELVFQLNGKELERQEVTLPEGEGLGSYELAFADIAVSLPGVAEGDQLDLWLEVELSDSQNLTASGGSWYCIGGQLELTAG